MSRNSLFTSSGKQLVLEQPFARGGEGSIHAVVGQSDLVAKRYHSTLNSVHEAKLKAMLELRADRLLKLGAWPIDVLHEKPGGAVVGILMPRVDRHKQIHLLYSPKTRLVEFPQATWAYLIHTAANLARGFAVLHETNLVVGDVNHGNIGVSTQATVKFYDCDSFQVTVNGKQFLCEVGISTHTPPELQGKSFRGVVRTANHDLFGMSVMIFQLLFMGRHPFAGVNLASSDSTIETAITEFRFAYGSGAPTRKMRQPPATLALEAVSQPVATLFERAFSREGVTRGRPQAQEWVAALETLAKQLKQCAKGHHHLNSLTTCPWCQIEGQIGITLFSLLSGSPVSAKTVFDLAAMWAQVTAVPTPGQGPPLPQPSAYGVSAEPGLAQRARQLRQTRYFQGAVMVAIGLLAAFGLFGGPASFVVVAGVLFGAWKYTTQATVPLREELNTAASQARSAMQALEQRWRTEASEEAFLARRRELEAVRNQLQGLPAERQQRLQKLQTEQRIRQLHRYLDRFRIEDASINGIGAGRKATLQSWGIETAADVKEKDIQRVPGFGPALTGRLLQWRRDLERRFVFNPNQGIDPADLVRLDRDLDQKRLQLEQQLTQGLHMLRILRQQIVDKRASLHQQIKRAARDVAQAEANLKAL